MAMSSGSEGVRGPCRPFVYNKSDQPNEQHRRHNQQGVHKKHKEQRANEASCQPHFNQHPDPLHPEYPGMDGLSEDPFQKKFQDALLHARPKTPLTNAVEKWLDRRHDQGEK
jgi:hypothetical protein